MMYIGLLPVWFSVVSWSSENKSTVAQGRLWIYEVASVVMYLQHETYCDICPLEGAKSSQSRRDFVHFIGKCYLLDHVEEQCLGTVMCERECYSRRHSLVHLHTLTLWCDNRKQTQFKLSGAVRFEDIKTNQHHRHVNDPSMQRPPTLTAVYRPHSSNVLFISGWEQTKRLTRETKKTKLKSFGSDELRDDGQQVSTSVTWTDGTTTDGQIFPKWSHEHKGNATETENQFRRTLVVQSDVYKYFVQKRT